MAAKATGDMADGAAAGAVPAALLRAILPKKRMVLPEEVADVVLFLSSSMSSYMTGTSVTVHAAGWSV